MYKTLFKREPPTNACSKFYTTAFGEAYVQLKPETALQHMTHVIERLDLFALSDRDITLFRMELKDYFTTAPHSTNTFDPRTQSDSQTKVLTQFCPSGERQQVKL
ncbi:hypothetical protein CFIMG_008256RA00001 [Ceratocystis fimbriata CBS 114723]|uniref:Uncharacterized protein n=1 Tax=Ceratocystis fimbriata CBS 114723 TaxID=1035309 RepID=A0A2C5X5C9_9PEZI|nr:hypothetical protein CFIMG_008256RA00001 [Ceratocystis fimbriata CBS 114723]